MIPVIIISIVFFDRLSKILCVKLLQLHEPYSVIKGVFYLTLAHNRGAAFGVFRDQVIYFILVSLIAIVVIALSLNKNKKPLVYNIALSFILGGAIGNLIDRVSLGYVIDFLDFRVWPVFNIADSFITIGSVIFGWQVLIRKI